MWNFTTCVIKFFFFFSDGSVYVHVCKRLCVSTRMCVHEAGPNTNG